MLAPYAIIIQMPLDAEIPRCQAYFQTPALLFDTCGLTWFTKDDSRMRQLMEVSKSYLVIVPTPVMYELAFGVPGTASSNEEKLWAEINSHGRSHEMQHFNWLQLRNQVPKNGLMLINPGFNEWWTARTRILKYVEVAKAQPGKSKRNDSFDALIHAMARNLFVPVCTDNFKDFEKFNRAGTLINRDGVVPLFTPEQVVESLTGTVKYVPLHSS